MKGRFSYLVRPAKLIDDFGRLGIKKIGERGRAVVDTLFITGLIAVDTWLMKPGDFIPLTVMTYLLVIIAAAGAYRRVEKIPRGFSPPRPSLMQAFIVVALATMMGASFMLFGAWLFGALEPEFCWAMLGKPEKELSSWLFKKFTIVLGQQIGLQFVLFPLCFQVTRSAWLAALMGSSLFGLLHTPNPLLMAITFLGGPIWFWLYLYSGRILPLIISHLVLAILLRIALPGHVHLNLAIGAQAITPLEELHWLYAHGLWPQVNYYSSREYFRQQGGTNELLIRGFYRDILGRSKSESDQENRYWAQALQFKTRMEVAITFFTSDEYRMKQNFRVSH